MDRDTFLALKNIQINFYNSLTIMEKFYLISLILTLIMAIIMALSYFHPRPPKPKKKKPFPYELISLKNLPIKAGVHSAIDGYKMEQYIERESLKTKLGKSLTPTSRKVLIYGQSGIGKTREAVEIIRRLDQRYGKRNIFFSKRIITVPTGPPTDSLYRDAYRNIVLFIDDINYIKEKRIDDDEEIYGDLIARLQETIKFYEEEWGNESIDVILTMRTEQYESIKTELYRISEEFSCIELKELSQRETKTYIRNIAEHLGFEPLEQSVLDFLVKVRTESLTRFFRHFTNLKRRGETRFSMENVHELRESLREGWFRESQSLPNSQRLVFEAISKLAQFSLPSLNYIVVELCTLTEGGFRWFTRKKYTEAIRDLINKREIRLEDSEVSCSDFKLTLKNVRDPKLVDDLKIISRLAKPMSSNKKYNKDLYYVLLPLTHVLHNFKFYEEATSFLDRLWHLPSKYLPENPEKAKSQILFYEGYSYYSWSKIYWNKAEEFYNKSIKFDERNLFAKHALASLYHKKGWSLEALNLLDEITEVNENDLLTYKTKLEIHINTHIDFDRAKLTYQDIERILKSGVYFPLLVALSAEYTCIRFRMKIGEILRDEGKSEEAEKQFKEVENKYEFFIDKIPPDEYEFEAIVLNAYGCFLIDILGIRDKGITQLEKALETWPSHTESLHKLTTVYMRMLEEAPEHERLRYREKAMDYINKILVIKEQHYPSLLSLAILMGKSINWSTLPESLFWEKAWDTYKKYQESLESDTDDYPSYHNPIVHHAAGCFLWHMESQAYQKHILSSKPSWIPSAENEFKKSIEIEKNFGKTKIIPQRLRRHLIIAYSTLGGYLLTIARGDALIRQEGHEKLKKAVELGVISGGFHFYSWNSYAESYVAKILLDMGEKDEARRLLESSVKRLAKNWRAWWLLGGIVESDEKFCEAFDNFYKSANGQVSPMLLGWLRSFVQSWINDKHFTYTEGLNLKIQCSSRTYEIDPKGDLNPKNISDYGYDLYQMGKLKQDQEMLEKAKKLLLFVHKKYIIKHRQKEAGFSLWYAGECQQEIKKRVDREALEYFIESVKLGGSSEDFYNLYYKVIIYCSPIWRAKYKVNDDLIMKIEDCAKFHPELLIANKMIGYVLARNMDCDRALPYLEKIRASKDTYVLRSLMECYYAKGKIDSAEEVYLELYPLLEDQERKKLKERALQFGLKCP